MKDFENRQISASLRCCFATVLAYAGLIGAAAVTAQAADNAPVVQPITAQTCVDIAVEAELSAADADNDVVLYQLTEKPCWARKVKIEADLLYCHTGPQSRTRQFPNYTAVDAEGNTAQPAAITIEIKRTASDSPTRTWTVIRRITRRSIYRKRCNDRRNHRQPCGFSILTDR